jgi:hypothetical protein
MSEQGAIIYRINPLLQLRVSVLPSSSWRGNHFVQLLDIEYGDRAITEVELDPTLSTLSLYLINFSDKDNLHGFKREICRRYKGAKYWAGVDFVNTLSVDVFFAGNFFSKFFLQSEVLEPLFAWLLLQRESNFVHSSAVVLNDQGILFSGGRHTGKTIFLLMALMMGGAFVSDDYIALDPSPAMNGVVRMYGYPRRANIFMPHLKLVLGNPYDVKFKLYWHHKLDIYFKHLLRKLTGGFITLGHTRHLHKVLDCDVVEQHSLSKAIFLISPSRWNWDRDIHYIPSSSYEIADLIISQTLDEWEFAVSSLSLEFMRCNMLDLLYSSLEKVTCWLVKSPVFSRDFPADADLDFFREILFA